MYKLLLSLTLLLMSPLVLSMNDELEQGNKSTQVPPVDGSAVNVKPSSADQGTTVGIETPAVSAHKARAEIEGAEIKDLKVDEESTSTNKPLSLTSIFDATAIKTQRPKSLKFSADGNSVMYLRGKESDSRQLDLWKYDFTHNENKLLLDSQALVDSYEILSDEEKSRRAYQSINRKGITDYQLSPDGSALVFLTYGDIYHYDLTTKLTKRLSATLDFETDVKFSPRGRYISFIRKQNIYVLNVSSGKEVQVTKDGKGPVNNGVSDFVARKDLGRMTGYWWSPDEEYIAFLRTDESKVQTEVSYNIYAQEYSSTSQRYPRAGTENVKLTLAVADIKDKKIRTIDTGDNQDIYIPRVKWLTDSKNLSYQWQSRDQKTLKLNLYNLRNRRQITLLTESSTHWLNLHDDLTFLNDNKTFIWASERDGYKHLYHYNLEGEVISQLTKGKWVVDSLTHVDEQQGWIYFTGRADTPLESHLYKVPLSGKFPEQVQRISKRNGVHNIVFNKNSDFYLDIFSNISTPEQVVIHKADGEQLTSLVNSIPPIASPVYNNLVSPEFGALTSDDKTATLYYTLYKPQAMIPGRKYPVIVKVNGGPQAQSVVNKWQEVNLTHHLVEQGYIVFQLDNRGTDNRGTAFEFPIYQALGQLEVADQITGVKYLHTLPYVDQERVGIYGHSYGGYLALMAMFKAGKYFKAGVSGTPITDWLLSDTHYTERYLNHPKINSAGYEGSNVFPYLSGLSGPLMVYHNGSNEGILLSHTSKLIKALQDENMLFEMMLYPSSKEVTDVEKVKRHVNTTVVNFFDRHFK